MNEGLSKPYMQIISQMSNYCGDLSPFKTPYITPKNGRSNEDELD